jgi:long-chain acyl-CoA synthetase
MSINPDSASAQRPWSAVYPQVGIAPDLPASTHHNLAHFIHDHCTRWARDSQAKAAFTCVVPNGMNGSLSFAQVDALSDAFAG